jgi:hypothetical protein
MNRDVVRARLEVARDRVLETGRRRGRHERRRHREQLVDRRRLGRLFREAVALGERLDLVGADPVDQTIEVLTNARLGTSAVRGINQQVDRLVEREFGRGDVTGLELLLAGFERPLRFGDQRENRISGRDRGDILNGSDWRGLNRRGRGRDGSLTGRITDWRSARGEQGQHRNQREPYV